MVPIPRQLGVAETHAHAVPAGAFEQGANGGIGHLLFEPDVGLGGIGVVPAREKSGQRQLRVDDQIGTLGLGLGHQVEHAGDDHLAGLGLLDGAELGRGNGDDAGHGGSLLAV